MQNQPEDLRIARVVIYMTEDDAAFLARISKAMGFRSRSTMIVAILERLIIGGFSLAVWFKAGFQFQKRAQETNAFAQGGFYFGVRPLPALPVEDDPSPREVTRSLTELRKELKEETC
jgi:hypothetical protein